LTLALRTPNRARPLSLGGFDGEQDQGDDKVAAHQLCDEDAVA